MGKSWLPFASYNLWSLFASAVGQEHWHCDMKRGHAKVRKREPDVAAILAQDTVPQTIGLLAQQGVYEFHLNSQRLKDTDGAAQVAEILKLDQQADEVQERLHQILSQYYENPILLKKRIFSLSRGDESFPEPIKLYYGSITFNLFAAIDCILLEPDGTLHILDLKTGHSDFDERQAFVYLLAASYLFPRQRAIASFYNLELCKWSEPITATTSQLNAVRIELARLAQRHELEKKQYRKNPAEFDRIFPPNPGFRCQYCQFNSVCQFAVQEVSA
ncbi:PD-(D/E)XK nuclease family protein [Leptolyngbya sp. AN02str]|uniref:PD-(D/E)XK nuclease family protein n=1 Tax=Leptolyngbya sp. AN02str TaxID=3423363 RepID=UPI003D315E75